MLIRIQSSPSTSEDVDFIIVNAMTIQPTMSDPPIAGPSRAPYIPAQTLNAHSRSVTALTYSGDGRTLVSGGADGWVHFWYAPLLQRNGDPFSWTDYVGMAKRAIISVASKPILKVGRSLIEVIEVKLKM